MRLSIFSFKDNNNQSIEVEFHTSKSKIEAGNSPHSKQTQAAIHKVVEEALKQKDSEASVIKKIIISENWDEVHVVTEDKPSPQKLSAIKCADFFAKNASTIDTSPTRLTFLNSRELTSESLHAATFKQNFTAVTWSEKLWKFIFSIKSVFSSEKWGTFDLASHLFNKETSQRNLQKEMVSAATCLDAIIDFLHSQAPTPENKKRITEMKECKQWVNQIEELKTKTRDRFGSSVAELTGDLARSMEERMKHLTSGDSLLIPLSCYNTTIGKKESPLRLARLTCTEEKKGGKNYQLEFMMPGAPAAVTNIPANKLSADDFFKPLIEVQLPSSYFEENPTFFEKMKDRLYRLAQRHPKFITGRVATESSPQQREVVAAALGRAQEFGIASPSLQKRTALTSSDFGAILASLLSEKKEGDIERFSRIFEPPAILANDRAIDSLLPLLQQEEQVGFEISSLCQFYSLKKEELHTDPTSLAIVEAGLRRAATLCQEVKPNQEHNIERLKVIQEGVEAAKKKMINRSLNLSSAGISADLPDTFQAPPLNKINTSDFKKLGATQTTTLLEVTPLDSALQTERLAVERANGEQQRIIDTYASAAKAVGEHSVLSDFKNLYLREVTTYRKQLQAEVKTLRSNTKPYDDSSLKKQLKSGKEKEFDKLVRELKENLTTLDSLLEEETFCLSEKKIEEIDKLLYLTFQSNPYTGRYGPPNLIVQIAWLFDIKSQPKIPIDLYFLFESSFGYPGYLQHIQAAGKAIQNGLEQWVGNLGEKISLIEDQTDKNQFLAELEQIKEKSKQIFSEPTTDFSKSFDQINILLTNLAASINNKTTELKKNLQPIPDSDALLQNLKTQVEACTAAYKPPLTESNQLALRAQLHTIISTLPIESLPYAGSFWEDHKDLAPQIKQLQTLIEHAHQNKTQPTPLLQPSLCKAILYRMGIESKIQEEALITAFSALQDPYLRFSTPSEQRQLKAVFLVAQKIVDDPIDRLETRTTEILRDSKINLSKKPTAYQVLSDTDIQSNKRKIPPIPDEAGKQFDSDTRKLLDGYLQAEGITEGDLRVNTSEGMTGTTLDADMKYRLLATNSTDSANGLQELLCLIASKEFSAVLGEEDHQASTQILRVIQSRIFREGHLESTLKDPENLETLKASLKEAISKSLINPGQSEALLTLLEVQAAIGIFSFQTELVDQSLQTLVTCLQKPEYSPFHDRIKRKLLKIYAQEFKSGQHRQLTLQLPQLLDAWVSHRTRPAKYRDLGEEEDINLLFYGSILPTWKNKTEDEQKKILKQVFQFSFKGSSPSYIAERSDGSLALLNIEQGMLIIGGRSAGAAGETLPRAIRDHFPLGKEGTFSNVEEKKVGNSLVYSFTAQFGDIPRNFRAVVSKDVTTYSIGIPRKNKQTKWYQYTPLEKAQEKSAARTEKHALFFADSRKKIQEQLNILDEYTKKKPSEATVPKDLIERGIWIQEDNKAEAVSLDRQGTLQETLTLNHTAGNFRIERISRGAGTDKELHLVNNPKSSLYLHLTGMTHKENIKLWADTSGTLQRIELLDPKIIFERDVTTKKLMCSSFPDFYISEDQNLPVSNFSGDWSNFLLLENAEGRKKIIMRQNTLDTVQYLEGTTFRSRLEQNFEQDSSKEETPLVDMDLIQHPEQGWVVHSTKPQANLYLGTASLQSRRFQDAATHIRKAAQSASYSKNEQKLIRNIFSYRKNTFEAFMKDPLLSGSTTEVFQNILSSIAAHEPELPHIAALKLIALATLLRSESTNDKNTLPEKDDVRKWLEIYHFSLSSGDRYEALHQNCRVSEDELRTIAMRFSVDTTRPHSMTLLDALPDRLRKDLFFSPSDESNVVFFTQQMEISKLTSGLAEVVQTTSQMETSVFYAGSSIRTHFRQLYEEIDGYDAHTPEGKESLAKIGQRLNRFRDVDPLNRAAINCLIETLNAKLDNPELGAPEAIGKKALEEANKKYASTIKNEFQNLTNKFQILQVSFEPISSNDNENLVVKATRDLVNVRQSFEDWKKTKETHINNLSDNNKRTALILFKADSDLLQKNLNDIEKFLKHVLPPSGFPERKKDPYDETRMNIYFGGLLTSIGISPTLDTSQVKSESIREDLRDVLLKTLYPTSEVPYPLPTVVDDFISQKTHAITKDNVAKIAAELQFSMDPTKTQEEQLRAKLRLANLVGGYQNYQKELLPFLNKLKDEELVSCNQYLSTQNQDSLNKILAHSAFYERPDRFALLEKMLAIPEDVNSTSRSIQEASQKMLNRLTSSKQNSREDPKISPKETIQPVTEDKATPLLEKPLTISLLDPESSQQSVKELEGTQEAVVHSLRQEILTLTHTLSENPEERNKEELKRLSGKASTIQIEKVFLLYAKGRLSELSTVNPHLTVELIQELKGKITTHHLEATKLQLLKKQTAAAKEMVRLKSIFDTLKKHPSYEPFIRYFEVALSNPAQMPLLLHSLNFPREDLNGVEGYTAQKLADLFRDYNAAAKAFDDAGKTKRYYNPLHTHAHTQAALAYEHTLGVTFRPHQIAEFTQRVGSPDIVSWLGTGFGKTFMAPGLAKMMTTGKNLVCVVDTKDLIPTTSKTRDRDSREVYGQSAYRFEFARDPDCSVESLEEIKYQLLRCITEEEYVVFSKEALGSLALQLLTWQRLNLNNEASDKRIELTQEILTLFRERGIALGDEIHQILNVIEALDYSEGDKISLEKHQEYYQTTSAVFGLIYPTSSNPVYNERSEKIAGILKLAENRQAQCSTEEVRTATGLMADLIIDQSLDIDFTPKTQLHIIIKQLNDKGLTKENLKNHLLIGTAAAGEAPVIPRQITDLDEAEKKWFGSLKEILSNTFEKVHRKVADEDFGLHENGLSICPYDKGQMQPGKELDDIFQVISTHYIWYKANGIPPQGLKDLIKMWQKQVTQDLISGDYTTTEETPSYRAYQALFKDHPDFDKNLLILNEDKIHNLAASSRNHPQILYRFLETVVFPKQFIFPKKIGFNSMDLVSMFYRFGGYSGTVQTRESFHQDVKRDQIKEIEDTAWKNFQPVYENPKNQAQFTLPDLDSKTMVEAAQSKGRRIPLLSQQLENKVNLKDYRALIDEGGLFKELEPLDIAQDILSQFSPDELDAVLVHNNKSELMILRRGSNKLEPFQSKTIPPEYDKRFTIYRQSKTTGVDIPQHLFAKALVTISEKTKWGGFEQSVGRLRRNKEGQTYAVIYRQSLLDSAGKEGKIDVKELTEKTESEELKTRRYYSAIAQMQDMVTRQVRTLLCTSEWKEVFSLFQDELFEDTLRSADSLLQVKQPIDATKSLEKYRSSLQDKIKNALEKTTDPIIKTALSTAQTDLNNYKFPDKEEMPEKVLGTKGDTTRQTEVNKEKEVEKEQLAENITSRENITFTELQSSVDKSSTEQHKWAPQNLLSLFSLTPNADKTHLLETNAKTFFKHFIGNTHVSYDRLFQGVSITENLIPGQLYSHKALLSKGQKTAQSFIELSTLDQKGERIFHNLLMDLQDHKVFEEHFAKFKAACSKQKEVRSSEDNDIIKKFLGTSEVPNSLSIRVNVNGTITRAWGHELTEEEKETALKTTVRSKIINGELNFVSKREKEVLKNVLREFALMNKSAPPIISKHHLQNACNLYAAAVKVRRPNDTIDMNSLTFTAIAGELMAELNKLK